MDQPCRWTRVEDDTGGGVSMTNFHLLYLEGDSTEAAILIYQLFEQPINRSTREYGSVFALKSFPSFELASAYDRGCEWVRGEPYPRPNEPSQQSWRKYAPSDDWERRCFKDFDQARKHSRDFDAPRYEMFLARRADVLAACLPEWEDGLGRDEPLEGAIRAALEFVDLARREGSLWPRQPNLEGRSASLARVMALGLRALVQDGPDEPSWIGKWRPLGEALSSADVALALRLRQGALAHDAPILEEACVAEALALAWSAKGHPGAERVLALFRAMPEEDIAGARELCQQMAQMPETGKHRPGLVGANAWLEAVLVERESRQASQASPRARL